MADIPTKIYDSAVQDVVNFDKYAASLNERVQKLLQKTQNEIVASIAANDPTAPTMTKWKLARLEKLNEDISAILETGYGAIKSEVDGALKSAGTTQAANVVNSLNKAIGADIFDVTLTPEVVSGIVENTMIQGNVIGQWWDKQSADVQSKLSASMAAGTQAIQIGLMQGESIGDLINRVRGTKLTPGIMSVTKREATALVRTSVMQVANAVRMETYKANRDLLEGIAWCSTLDNRTTPLCQALDGHEWDMELNPIDHDMEYPGGPPAHWQCFIDGQIPIYTSKGWKPIGKIHVGDLVLTHKGRFRKVTKLIFTPKQKPEVVKIALKGQKHYQSGRVSMTIGHPVMINGRWRSAGEIKDGDKVSFLSHKCHREECTNAIPYYKEYCSLSCRSLEAGKVAWTDERRKKISNCSRAQMLREYELGLRNKFDITKKANVVTRNMFKNGKHPFQNPDVHNKAVVNSHKSEHWRKGVVDYLKRDNPIYRPGVAAAIGKKLAIMYSKNPETHPNFIMAKKGFVSSLENKMMDILDKMGVDFAYQYPIKGYWLDFAVPSLNIGIEVDGEYWHQDSEADCKRQSKIESEGWQIFRFTGQQMKNNQGEVEGELNRIFANHEGQYEFSEMEVVNVQRWTVRKSRMLYNFSVEEDESYVANGFVVHNCRSTILPVTLPWSKLAGTGSKLNKKQLKELDKIPVGERASMGGLVPTNMNYNSWLLTQPVEVQQDILGFGKWKLWSENKLSVTDLVDNSGNPLTLKELQAKLGDIVAKQEVEFEKMLQKMAAEADSLESFSAQVGALDASAESAINFEIDTSDMPLSKGALWSDLADPEYRNFLLKKASKGESTEVVPHIDKLNNFATNSAFLSKEKQIVYFGLDGEKFVNLKVGDTFESLGTRSTALTLKRAQQYAGDNGVVFQLEVPKGVVCVNAKVLGLEERMLLPGSKFEMIGKADNFIKVKLIDDGSTYVKGLYDLQKQIDELAGKLGQSVTTAEMTNAVPKIIEEKGGITKFYADVQKSVETQKAAREEAKLIKAIKDPEKVVTFVPGQPLPPGLYKPVEGAVQATSDAEKTVYGKLKFEVNSELAKPMEKVTGLKNSAGMIVLDDSTQGQVWVYSPKNQFGGYKNTFPKGTLEGLEKSTGLGIQEQAIREVFEETGLQAKPLFHLGDYTKTTSNTRYFVGVKTGGSPTMMGWEAEAVKLVPIDKLDDLLNVAVDKKIAKDFIEQYNQALKLGEGNAVKGFEILVNEEKSKVALQNLVDNASGDLLTAWLDKAKAINVNNMTWAQKYELAKAEMDYTAKKAIDLWKSEIGTIGSEAVKDFKYHGDWITDYSNIIKKYNEQWAQVQKQVSKLTSSAYGDMAYKNAISKGLIKDSSDPLIKLKFVNSEMDLIVQQDKLKAASEAAKAAAKLEKETAAKTYKSEQEAKNVLEALKKVQKEGEKTYQAYVAGIKPGTEFSAALKIVPSKFSPAEKINWIIAEAAKLEKQAAESIKSLKALNPDVFYELSVHTPNWEKLSKFQQLDIFGSEKGLQIKDAADKYASLLKTEEGKKAWQFLDANPKFAKLPVENKVTEMEATIKGKYYEKVHVAAGVPNGKLIDDLTNIEFKKLQALDSNIIDGLWDEKSQIWKKEKLLLWDSLDTSVKQAYLKSWESYKIPEALREITDSNLVKQASIEAKKEAAKVSEKLAEQQAASAGKINGKLIGDLTEKQSMELHNLDYTVIYGTWDENTAAWQKSKLKLWDSLDTSVKQKYIKEWTSEGYEEIPKPLLGDVEKKLMADAKLTVSNIVPPDLSMIESIQSKAIAMGTNESVAPLTADEFRLWNSLSEAKKTKYLTEWADDVGATYDDMVGDHSIKAWLEDASLIKTAGEAKPVVSTAYRINTVEEFAENVKNDSINSMEDFYALKVNPNIFKEDPAGAMSEWTNKISSAFEKELAVEKKASGKTWSNFIPEKFGAPQAVANITPEEQILNALEKAGYKTFDDVKAVPISAYETLPQELKVVFQDLSPGDDISSIMDHVFNYKKAMLTIEEHAFKELKALGYSGVTNLKSANEAFQQLSEPLKKALINKYSGESTLDVLKQNVFSLKNISGEAIEQSGLVKMGPKVYDMSNPADLAKFKANQTYNVGEYVKNIAQGKKITTTQQEAFDLLSTTDKSKALTKVEKLKAKLGTAGPVDIVQPSAVKTAELNFDNMVKYKGQAGSNKGAYYHDANNTAERYYIKTPANEEMANNEMLAGKLYQAAGVEVPDLKFITVDGKKSIASPIMDSVEENKEMLIKGLVKSGVQDNFVVDAWLGNWDVVGLNFDNLLIKDGVRAVRIDVGGALRFRAQGGAKGLDFGNVVNELKTLRDARTNPQSAAVFKNITKSQMEAGARKVLSIADSDIRHLVNVYGPADPIEKQKLMETLIARKQYIQEAFPNVKVAEAVKPISTEARIAEFEFNKLEKSARINGIQIPIDVEQIEDRRALLWIEKRKDGSQAGMINLKLREEANAQMDKIVGKPGKASVYSSKPIYDSALEALRGIAMQSRKGEVLRLKDIERAKVTVKLYKDEINKLLANAKYGNEDVLAMGKYYEPWIKVLEDAIKVGENNKLKWDLDNTFKTQFHEFADLKQILEKKAKGAPKIDIHFDKKDWTIMAKKLSKGFGQRTDSVLYNRGHYLETEIDGIKFKYWPNNKDVDFAMRGNLMIETPTASMSEMEKALMILEEKFGINTARASDEQLEALYLRQVAYARNEKRCYDLIERVEKLGTDAEKIEAYQNELNKIVGYNIKTSPNYNYRGTSDLYGVGKQNLMRPDLEGAAWEKFKKDQCFYHSIQSNQVKVAESILDNGCEYSSTVEKTRKGFVWSNTSPTEDLKSGGGNYCFLRVRSSNYSNDGWYWKGDLGARADMAFYPSDFYGCTNDEYAWNHFSSYVSRGTPVHNARITDPAKWNSDKVTEAIAKQSLSIFDKNFDCWIVSSVDDYDAIIKIFREHGFNEWPDGRKLTDVIRRRR